MSVLRKSAIGFQRSVRADRDAYAAPGARSLVYLNRQLFSPGADGGTFELLEAKVAALTLFIYADRHTGAR